ncbi:MAG TPA: rRNA maturation RNase YbeY [Ktedonobacteraceae bacterium]|jgi:probable rRNA maturation factor|nr:rRNA maturation RNase YbeY [Ktedonobacteraceae bacterium]
MQQNNIDIEISIPYKDAESDQTLQRLLASALPEQVIRYTLQEISVFRHVSLSLIIMDDEEIQTLNRQYRQQDKPTDVLSFPLLDAPLIDAPADQLWQETSGAGDEALPAFVTPPGMPVNLGDIVISWPTVQRQAEQAGHSATYEFLYLLSHGVLHLVGYDDQTEAGYQAMVHLQETVMHALGQKS